MPELPEVETTRLGIKPYLSQQTISQIIIRQPRLRLTIPDEFASQCEGKIILDVQRRAKYLLLPLSQGYLMIHLGMTGHLRIIKTGQTTPGKHDHLDLCLENGFTLRYNDSRRFGLWLYAHAEPDLQTLLAHLGPEPLTQEFNTDYLAKKAKGRNQCIKSFIMNNHVVVGVGNIYATEVLFLAGIHPLTAAGLLSNTEFDKLTQFIKQILQRAIQAGGTTLRDFYAADGKPGYFTQNLQVYGRKNQPCMICENNIQSQVIAGRSSAFCPQCQPLKTA